MFLAPNTGVHVPKVRCFAVSSWNPDSRICRHAPRMAVICVTVLARPWSTAALFQDGKDTAQFGLGLAGLMRE